MNFNRKIDELETNAILWWPEHLNKANAAISVLPKLLQTQDYFLKIISLSKDSPYQVFDLLIASKFPANLFLKHLCVLADYGGEPIQRLGSQFASIFKEGSITFSWDANNYTYEFKSLPLKGLSSKKLSTDGKGLLEEQPLTNLYRDMIILLMFGSTSTVSEEGALSTCEIGTLLGKTELLEKYVKERYISVSRIISGANSNSLGQLAQKGVVEHLTYSLGASYSVISNGHIQLDGYTKDRGMPFDIVVKKGSKQAGIEVSFQVTTNSVIERKAGQAADRLNLMHSDGYNIAYVIDGAGNFQRTAAVSTICTNSDCTVAYSTGEFEILSQWLREVLD